MVQMVIVIHVLAAQHLQNLRVTIVQRERLESIVVVVVMVMMDVFLRAVAICGIVLEGII